MQLIFFHFDNLGVIFMWAGISSSCGSPRIELHLLRLNFDDKKHYNVSKR